MQIHFFLTRLMKTWTWIPCYKETECIKRDKYCMVERWKFCLMNIETLCGKKVNIFKGKHKRRRNENKCKRRTKSDKMIKWRQFKRIITIATTTAVAAAKKIHCLSNSNRFFYTYIWVSFIIIYNKQHIGCTLFFSCCVVPFFSLYNISMNIFRTNNDYQKWRKKEPKNHKKQWKKSINFSF